MSNELDKYIGRTLQDYESAVDADALWESVKPPQKRKRRGFIWFFICLGLITGLGWWQFGQVGEELPDSALAIKQNGNIANDIADGRVISDGSIDQLNKSVGSKYSKENLLSSDKQNKKKGISSGSSINQKTISQLNFKLEEDGRGINSDGLIPKEASIFSPVNGPISLNKLIAIISKLSDKDDADLAAGIDKQISEIDASKSIEKSIQTITQPIQSLAFLPEFQENDKIEQEVTHLAKTTNRNPWSIEWNATYLSINREFSEPVESENYWPTQRLLDEQPLEAISNELSLSYRTKGNWELRVGLDYTRINSMLSLDDQVTYTDSTEGVHTLIVSTQNDTTEVIGTILAYHTIDYDKRTHNSFTQLELPIMLGYNLDKGRFNFLIEGGARLLLKRTWEGEILDLEENIIDLSSQDWYKDKLSFSLQAGLKVGYHLNPKLMMTTGVQLRYSPNNFTNSNSPIQENYQLFGGQIGLKWQF